jgi:hypothetical protein
LKKIKKGSCSTLLSRLVSESAEPQLENVRRSSGRKLAVQKGCFTLHANELSLLTDDVLFYLYTKSNHPKGKDNYFKIYPNLIALADGEFTAGDTHQTLFETELPTEFRKDISSRTHAGRWYSATVFSREIDKFWQLGCAVIQHCRVVLTRSPAFSGVSFRFLPKN